MSLPGFALEPGEDLGAFIDRAVFGEAHLWRFTQTWDPEGLLGTLPAIATGLAGVLTGHWLRSDREGSPSSSVFSCSVSSALGLGSLMGIGVSPQQVPLDQLLCGLYRRFRPDVSGLLVLAHRSSGSKINFFAAVSLARFESPLCLRWVPDRGYRPGDSLYRHGFRAYPSEYLDIEHPLWRKLECYRSEPLAESILALPHLGLDLSVHLDLVGRPTLPPAPLF